MVMGLALNKLGGTFALDVLIQGTLWAVFSNEVEIARLLNNIQTANDVGVFQSL